MTDIITLRKPDDFHIHLRQGDILNQVAPLTSASFARALVMPNISPPVKDGAGLHLYREQVMTAAGEGFNPLMTFKIMPAMKAETVKELFDAGALAGKYYPAGATTNSEDALSGWRQCSEALETMEQLGLPLSIHGEDPDAPALEREQAFIPVLDEIRSAYPELPLVFEHISSQKGVQWLKEQGPKVGATVTLHHLMLTIEDIIGGPLRPHLFCRPLPKTEKDRKAVESLVFSDFPRVFFGSDSAPHLKENKESIGGAAGIFTAPVLLPLLVQFFEERGLINKLESFISEKGAEYYGLALNEETITLKKEPWTVMKQLDRLVPFYGGRRLEWSLE